MATIILGSGIIGTATAYYLSQSSDHPIHLIEATSSSFQSASGFSGGFLAKDWFSPGVADLGALSFRLHRELAEEFGGSKRWGYEGSTALSLSVEEVGVGGKREKVRGKDWLLEGTSRREVASGADGGMGTGGGEGHLINSDGSPAWITPQAGGTLDVISSEGGCAQVEPLMLCQFLLEKCLERGVHLHLGSHAVGVVRDGEGQVTAVKIEQDGGISQIECRDVLIAAGAWTPRVFETLFPRSKLRIPIEPLAGYSLVVKSPRHTLVHEEKYEGAHSMFCAPGKHWKFAPEAISRKGREGETEIYVAGLNSTTMPLPELATDVKKDEEAMEVLRQVTVQLAGLSNEGRDIKEDDLEVVREGLCFRPVARGGRPILCKVKDKQLGTAGLKDGAVYVAAGHGPWGISMSLGTGMAMSELMKGEKTSARIDSLGMR